MFHLHTELETFEQILPKLLETSAGKFVVTKARKVLGIEPDYPSALKVGYAACGSETPFFVKLIESPKISQQTSRFLMARTSAEKEGKAWSEFSASQLARQYSPVDAIYDDE